MPLPRRFVTSVESGSGIPDNMGRVYGHRASPQRTESLLRRSSLLGAGIVLLWSPGTMLRGDEIYKSIDADGHVVYSDHVDPSMAQTSIVHLEDPRYPPHEMHFCWTNCFTLILDGGVYRRADGTDETWTVETFTAKSFVLHRHDAVAGRNGATTDVVYAGQAANDRWLGVTVNGKPTSGIDASWGTALNTLPGSNAERDAQITTDHQANEPAAAAAAVSTTVAPPPLPNESQPEVPEDGDLWTPGYWAWGGQAYAWVPGAWVQPPHPGLLWTPGYWSFAGTVYVFHPGYWGPHVGFYGGIYYGFGYFGTGYSGGRWVGNSFAYNSSVNHLNPKVIHNTYQAPAPNRPGPTLVSYNGGAGGTAAIPTAASTATVAPRIAEPHGAPTPPKPEPAPAPKHVTAASAKAPPKQ